VKIFSAPGPLRNFVRRETPAFRHQLEDHALLVTPNARHGLREFGVRRVRSAFTAISPQCMTPSPRFRIAAADAGGDSHSARARIAVKAGCPLMQELDGLPWGDGARGKVGHSLHSGLTITPIIGRLGRTAGAPGLGFVAAAGAAGCLLHACKPQPGAPNRQRCE